MNPSRTELLRWQLAGQFLASPAPGTAVAAGLCGLQAQYLSNAVYSLYLRSGSADTAGLVKSWTLRGTLHLFPASDFFLYHPDAPGVEGIFETLYGRWLYNGHCAVPRERMLLFARTVAGGLGDAPVSRDALRDLCRQAGMTRQEEERVFDGWGGVIRFMLYANDGTSTNGFFKGFVTSVEESNPGYQFNWDERSLADKLVGLVFGEEEYLGNDGKPHTSVKAQQARSVEAIRAGVPVPPAKKLNAESAKQAQGFTEVEDDELPF